MDKEHLDNWNWAMARFASDHQRACSLCEGNIQRSLMLMLAGNSESSFVDDNDETARNIIECPTGRE